MEERVRIKPERVASDSTRFIAKTFLYLFFALLLTAGVALGLGALFNYLLVDADVSTMNNAAKTYIGLMIGSAILTFGLVIWIRLSVFSRGNGIVVPFILYSICMGILLSSFTLFLKFYELALGVGITSVVFGLMALVGLLAGDRVRTFGLIGMGLFFGAFIISSFSLIWYFISPDTYEIMYTVISVIMFLAILLMYILSRPGIP